MWPLGYGDLYEIWESSKILDLYIYIYIFNRDVSCAYDLSCHCYPSVVLLQTRIVRIIFPCTLLQTDNCCPTTVYRNSQCMWVLINVSGVLRGHYTVDLFYDWNLCFLLWCLSLFLPLNWCFLLCIFDHTLECDILWMYLFLPYCVRKLHNKTVQSIIYINKTASKYAQWFLDMTNIQSWQ